MLTARQVITQPNSYQERHGLLVGITAYFDASIEDTADRHDSSDKVSSTIEVSGRHGGGDLRPIDAAFHLCIASF